jgi:hypothetical protein
MAKPTLSPIFVILASLLVSLPSISSQSLDHCPIPCNEYMNLMAAAAARYGLHVSTPGESLSTGAVYYVCNNHSTTIHQCATCAKDGYTEVESSPLYAWDDTCQTLLHEDIIYAVGCWEAMPTGSNACWKGAAVASPTQSQGVAPQPSKLTFLPVYRVTYLTGRQQPVLLRISLTQLLALIRRFLAMSSVGWSFCVALSSRMPECESWSRGWKEAVAIKVSLS